MGADMLTAHITTRTTNPEELDWDAAAAALAQVSEADQFHFGDPEDEAERWLDLDDDRDVRLSDGSLDLAVLKDMGAAVLHSLREELPGRDVDILTIGGVDAFVSGGLSHGDSPTDACDAIWAANALPASVLHAAGLGVDIRDDQVDGLAKSSRTPAQIVNDLFAVVSMGVGPGTEEILEGLCGQVIDTVRDAYSLALRDPELGLATTVIEKIEATVSDAVSNNWF